MRKILVAVDGFEPSLAAAKKALELAQRYGATVIALQVEEKTLLLPTEKRLEASQTKGMISEAPLNLLQEYGQRMGCDIRTMKTAGVVAGTILQTAQKQQVDLIVMGDSARKGLEKMHFGSVAESVLKGSSLPVLVVKRGAVDLTDLKELAGNLAGSQPNPTVIAADSLALLRDSRRRNFLLSFGFLAIFGLFYFTTAIINTPNYQTVAGQLCWGIPLGVWLGFMIFPVSIALCCFYLRLGR
ncbi:universal stress protein [Desulforamulus ferrireducens]|uniref:Universal stress protein UspA n=1 Tax=Desulforamulus ferrireducens TaxID=1833852 RepID=A0A1S6IYZ1_9FIRM|nr:universal stress protein [Desulforamulus ferrireducens]AQS59985.1 universal stress protein UspA [Desulforamulus ferrireducens]